MGKNKLQDAIYSYLVLYKNGITVEDVLANKEVFNEICNSMDKKDKNILNANLDDNVEKIVSCIINNWRKK